MLELLEEMRVVEEIFYMLDLLEETLIVENHAEGVGYIEEIVSEYER